MTIGSDRTGRQALEWLKQQPEKKLPKELEYVCRYNWDLPNIGAQRLVEMIKKYREGTASGFEKLIVNIFSKCGARVLPRYRPILAGCQADFPEPCDRTPEPARKWKYHRSTAVETKSAQESAFTETLKLIQVVRLFSVISLTSYVPMCFHPFSCPPARTALIKAKRAN